MRSKLLTTLTIVLFFLSLSIPVRAQEEQGKTYIITDNGSVKNIQPYVDALNKANMKYHRLKEKRFTIVFNTGVAVQLFSAAECIANGRNINLVDYPYNFDATRYEPVFSLGPDNFILEAHGSVNKK